MKFRPQKAMEKFSEKIPLENFRRPPRCLGGGIFANPLPMGL